MSYRQEQRRSNGRDADRVSKRSKTRSAAQLFMHITGMADVIAAQCAPPSTGKIETTEREKIMSKRIAKPVGVFHETLITGEYGHHIRTITLIERYSDADYVDTDNGQAIANLDEAIARLEDLKRREEARLWLSETPR
jgi:hypothetical protein